MAFFQQPARLRLAGILLALILSLPAAAQDKDKPRKSLLDQLRGDLKKLEKKDQQTAQSAQAKALQQQTATLRGLAFRRPVKLRVMNKQQLAVFLRKMLNEQDSASKMRGMQQTYVALGLLRPGVDLRKLLISLNTEGIAGFYDPKTKQLYLISEKGQAELKANRQVWIHELTHALDDQHFDLARLDKQVEQHDDRQLALSVLIEGAATFTMFKATLPRRAGALADPLLELFASALRLSEAAKLNERGFRRFYTARSIAPYREGLRFVQALHKRGGWKAVDRAYRKPPISTEQVLHPGKYLAGETPVRVAPPALKLGQSYKLIATNHFGELQIRLLLRHHLLPSSLAAGMFSGLQRMKKGGLLGGLYNRTVRRISPVEMAAGWAGDAYQLFSAPEGPPVLLWRTRWDSPAEAAEFADGYARVLAKTHGKRRWFDRRTWKISRQGRTSGVRRQGDRVDILLNVPKANWPR